MNFKRLSIALAAVNLMVAPTIADEPTREDCELGFAQWTFQTDLIESVIRTDGGVAVTLNDELLDQLEAGAQAYVRHCIAMLVSDGAEPEEWPLRPEEEI